MDGRSCQAGFALRTRGKVSVGTLLIGIMGEKTEEEEEERSTTVLLYFYFYKRFSLQSKYFEVW